MMMISTSQTSDKKIWMKMKYLLLLSSYYLHFQCKHLWWTYMCNRWKNSNHQCRSWGSNPVHWTQSPKLYHVAIKAGLYRKAVQVYHIPITTTYSPSILRFVHESQFEQPLNTRPPSLLDHQALQMGLFTLGARCNRWKNSNHQCCSWGSNLVRWTQSPTLYHVAIKAGLYHKAVQVYHIPITTTYVFIHHSMNTMTLMSCPHAVC